ncbi:DUF2163 domain-containing protein [Cypionkella sp.]|uniref:DUF2163 domain-containing protein n=1 Tax=Cypionkella sp. TaxID=2811411 RepID=UPI002722BC3C|nr:DUF2163 domain-containing protein [Cypionkella sp.]MDO8983262.1 DUF2163 domain-containing protein [Cypionkella sp.]MDP2048529.1 DUF2163 domain-containing protein [Cypionkella sp.]
MSARQELLDHLGQGVTTVCRAWLVTRRDGVQFGFTDHDLDLGFEGHVFKASSGMTARTLQQTTGLSVDNSETVGGLSDAAVDEADLIAGRFDGAEVRAWLVNWADPAQRIEQFRGNLGEISRVGGAFKAELRGLTDRLNQPQGRIFQRSCTAVLGDARCRVDLIAPGNFAETSVAGLDALNRCLFEGISAFADRWFERGRFVVTSGAAAGLVGVIKFDRLSGTQRVVDLWYDLGAQIAIGDQVRLEVGCDRMSTTCRTKFDNFANFRGFPHIPGEDWLASYPVNSRTNDGGSLGR